MNAREMRREAVRALDSLPAEFREQLHNLAVVVVPRPTREQLEELGLDPDTDTLYGLYEGTPLEDRSVLDFGLLPDKISIFLEPLRRDFPDPGELRRQVRLTVLHEIAHYFGMEEREIEELGY